MGGFNAAVEFILSGASQFNMDDMINIIIMFIVAVSEILSAADVLSESSAPHYHSFQPSGGAVLKQNT